MSCSLSGASIYYTLDGSEPTSASTLYTSPVTLEGSVDTTVKAKAYAAGYSPSATATGTFAPAPWDSCTKLLLHFDGTNGSTVFTNSGASTATASGSGNAQISTAQGKFNSSSLLLDGSGDYISSTSYNMALGTGDFTIDGWFYLSAVNDRTLFGYSGSNANGIAVFADQASQRRVYVGSSVLFLVSGAFPTGTWTHIALVRSSGTVTLYQNGTAIGSAACSTNLTATTLQIGRSLYGDFSGYVDEFRVTKGVARWTGNFIPPASAYPSSNGDSDADGLPDWMEANGDVEPSGDADGDGLTNAEELLLGTDPLSADSDGDGMDDKAEIDAGYDPLRYTKRIYADASKADDTGDGLSEATAKKTLSAALSLCKANDGTEHVLMALPGTYSGSSNRGLDFGSYDIKVRGRDGAATTIIDCEGSGRAFNLTSGQSSESWLDGLTIRNGYYSGDAGAVYLENARPVIKNCAFESNRATSTGGAIHGRYISPTLIKGCRFTGNRAGSQGGAIYTGGGTLVCEGSLFEGNVSASYGGAIGMNSNGAMTLTKCEFRGNAGSYGGAVWRTGNDGAITLDGCLLTDNFSSCEGSGFMAEARGAVTIRNSLIAGNTAYGDNSAVAIPYGSHTVLIESSTIARNTSRSGVQIRGSTDDSATVRNSIVWGATTNFNPASVSYSCLSTSYAGTGNITSDPLLTAAGRLTASSPCIGAGTAGGAPATDLFGNPRPSGSGADIGCEEFIDSDADGLPDWVEANGDVEPSGDADGDGLTNLQEYLAGTNPFDTDSDSDGIADGVEVAKGLNPLRVTKYMYVDASASDDSGSGLTREAAKKTIGAALSAIPNDANEYPLLLLAGTYSGSGNTALEITSGRTSLGIQSESGKDSTIIDGEDANYFLKLTGTQNQKFRLDGLTIRNMAGGVYGRAMDVPMPATLSNCAFKAGKEGMRFNGGSLSVDSCSFEDFACDEQSNCPLLYVEDSSATIENSEFKNNGARGIVYADSSSLSISRTEFVSNAAWDYGGAVYLKDGSLDMKNCLVAGCSARYGGAVLVQNSLDSQTVSISNCTVTGNSAGEYGEGIYAIGTVPAVVRNSIIWGNGSGALDCSPAADVQYSDVEGGHEGTGNISADPLFVSAATGDYDMADNSPCVNAGIAISGISTDIRGVARPQSSAPDMGAYEHVMDDSDNDGLTDAWETSRFGSLAQTASGDADGDGLTNLEEFQLGSDPASDLLVENGCSLHSRVVMNPDKTGVAGWDVYDKDPAGTISCVADPQDAANRVMQLSGGGTNTGFRYKFAPVETSRFIAEWRMKYSESYIIYFLCKTSAGSKYVYYTASDTNALGTEGYVHHGLGKRTADGSWRVFRRNLQKDIEEGQPGVQILSVDAFLIRGSGYVDRIRMLSYQDADGDLIPDELETAVGLNPADPSDASGDLDGDGLTNLEESAYGTNLTLADTDGDGLTDYFELRRTGTDPLKADSDADGLNDGQEDPDGDGVSNLDEQTAGSDPLRAGTSSDGYQAEGILHEDAENGDAAGWTVYDNDPVGTILNSVDPLNLANRVIRLSGGGTATGFKLALQTSSVPQTVLQWRMKYSEAYVVYILCQTTEGSRYIYYTPVDTNGLGTSTYVHHGLGKSSKDGKWRVIRRNLQRDLEDAQPGAVILSVDAFLIRGSGYVDDVRTFSYVDADGDLIPDAVELQNGLNPADASDAAGDLDGDGLKNVEELLYGSDMTKSDSDGDGLDDYYEVKTTSTCPYEPDTDFNGILDGDEDPDCDGLTNAQEKAAGLDPMSHISKEVAYPADLTVQEDAEDGDTAGWSVYDNDPPGTIENVENPDCAGERVIRLQGSATNTGFKYTFASPSFSQLIVEWRMKYSESYIIYFLCQTSDGAKYIYYTPSNTNSLGSTGAYVHHGLGTASRNGAWQVFRRNLQKDLNDGQPGVVILSVDAFLIRGSGYVDGIKTMDYLDADGDLMPDTLETELGLNPADASDAGGDLDGDGLSNLKEVLYGTKANVADSDGDGVSDGAEVNQGLNPAKADSDGDGIADGTELQNGTNAKTAADSDADGLPDDWETAYFGNLAQGAGDDPDDDNADNISEYNLGMNPAVASEGDSDGVLKLKAATP